MELSENIKILKINRDETISTDDPVAAEIIITIILNNEEFASLHCSPIYLKELAVGILLEEKMIGVKEDIELFNINLRNNTINIQTRLKQDELKDLRKTRFIIPDCTSSSTFTRASDEIICEKIDSVLTVSVSSIFSLLKEFNRKAQVYIDTGGTHSAALCSKNRIIFFNEDIGRHNTIDKIIGWSFLKNISLSDKFMITSGRVSSSVAVKLVKAGVPVIISRSAPTGKAVMIARRYNLTLAGFARGKRMNIYSGHSRILF